jgi:hypothetical protein
MNRCQFLGMARKGIAKGFLTPARILNNSNSAPGLRDVAAEAKVKPRTRVRGIEEKYKIRKTDSFSSGLTHDHHQKNQNQEEKEGK